VRATRRRGARRRERATRSSSSPPWRSSGRSPRRWGGGGGAEQRRRRCAAGELGFGGEGGAARRWRPLNRPGSRLGMRACGQTRAHDLLGVGSLPPVGLRPEVGDDGWGPPVSDSGRAAAVLGRAGAKRRAGPGIEGASAEFCNLGSNQK
jgi:hypothetical protein